MFQSVFCRDRLRVSLPKLSKFKRSNQHLSPLKCAEGLLNATFDFKLSAKFQHNGVKSNAL